MDAKELDITVSSALSELQQGTHPLAFLSSANLSLSDHAKLYLGNPVYRSKVNLSAIDCLAHWKGFTAQQFGHKAKPKTKPKYEQTAKDVYNEICARSARANGDADDDEGFTKKSDWLALFRHIDDIEHYAYKIAPDIKTMSRNSPLDITDTEQTNMFEIGFIDG